MARYKLFRHTRSRRNRPGKSLREGGIKQFPRQRRPLPQARKEPRALLRQFGLASLMRPASIKPRRELPSNQGRDTVNRVNRLPYLGLRSQRVRTNYYAGGLINLKIDLREVKQKLPKTKALDHVCSSRKARRQTLFSIKKAGKGLKRSPGRGGTYRRTEQSQTSCGG